MKPVEAMKLEPTKFIGNPVQAARVEVLTAIGWAPFDARSREHLPGLEGLAAACEEYRLAEDGVRRGDFRGAVLWVGVVVGAGALRAGENAEADRMVGEINSALKAVLPRSLAEFLDLAGAAPLQSKKLRRKKKGGKKR